MGLSRFVPGLASLRSGRELLGVGLLVGFSFGLSGLLCAGWGLLNPWDLPRAILRADPLAGRMPQVFLYKDWPGVLPFGQADALRFSAQIDKASFVVERIDPVVPNSARIVNRTFRLRLAASLVALVAALVLGRVLERPRSPA